MNGIDPDFISFIYHLLVALGIGSLIGLERQRHGEDRLIIAGVRTFSLVAITGCMLAFLSLQVEFPGLSYLVYVGFFIFGAMAVMLFYIRHSLEMSGLTTPVALLVAFTIGVFIGIGMVYEGVVLGIATTFLLLTKRRLHHVAAALTEDEMLEALQFLTIAVILVPITAQMKPISIGGYELIGPGTLFDLYWILLIVIFVSSISFISFIIMRRVGTSKGLEFSGLLGGLVNSEATTVSLADMASKGVRKENIRNSALVGIILANGAMLIRNLLICSFSDPSLKVAGIIFIPLAVMILISMITTVFLKKRTSTTQHKIEIKTPFAIVPALRFACLFAAVSACAYLIQTYFGGMGIYMLAIGGFVSSAAVVASVSSLAFTGSLDPWVAAQTSVLACIISTFYKLILIRAVSKPLAQKAKLPITLTALIGLIFLVILIVASLI
jgi:uncharacterized membrane protein (DUF4010 family)